MGASFFVPFISIHRLPFTVHRFTPMLSNRPKITLENSGNDRFIQILLWGTLAGIWLFAALNYHALPERIPIHFDGSGAVNGWGSKASIFLLPAIATLLAVFMQYIGRHPEWHNYPVKVTPANASALYTASSKTLRWVSYLVVLLFFVIEMTVIDTARSQTVNYYFPVIWIIVAGIIIIPIIQLIRMYKLR